jgi:putative methionine-R-sulfoxide reductase with GAF domain
VTHDPRPEPGTFEAALRSGLHEAAAATDAEHALFALTRVAHRCLGDQRAGVRPGERDYRIAGVFLVTPDRRYNMLVAGIGFPPEQRRLMIPIAWNHPGRVVATGEPILIRDTDAEAGRFKQFLKSSRMGSSMYVPIRAGGEIVGQIVAAAQARLCYDAPDLARLATLAAAAALAWRATTGAAWLADAYPPQDAWRAEDHVQGEAIA